MTAGDRHLVFRAGGRRLALRATEVDELAADRPLTPLAVAPPDIAGVTVARGRLLTVLDVGGGQEATDGCLIILAAPWSHLALRVAGDVEIEDGPQHIETLDVEALARRIELTITNRGD